MQQLLMDNILPLASRRRPLTAQSIMSQRPVETLLTYYVDALTEIYRFYAASSEIKMVPTNNAQQKGMTFDDLKEESSRDKSVAAKPGSEMSYPDFLRFAGDLGFLEGMPPFLFTIITSSNLQTIYG